MDVVPCCCVVLLFIISVESWRLHEVIMQLFCTCLAHVFVGLLVYPLSFVRLFWVFLRQFAAGWRPSPSLVIKKPVNLKHSPVVTVIFRFKPASQFVEQRSGLCTDEEGIISKMFGKFSGWHRHLRCALLINFFVGQLIDFWLTCTNSDNV